MAFRYVLAELMRVRYVAPEKELQTTFEGVASRVKKVDDRVGGAAWSLPISNWKERPRVADSLDFYDTEAVMRKAFDKDWSLAIRTHGLADFIKRLDDGESDDEEETANEQGDVVKVVKKVDEDGDGVDDDEVVEVALVLWKHHKLIYAMFDVYSSMSSASGAVDVTRISSNAYRRFLKDSRLVIGGKVASAGNFDQIFVLVNAKDEGPRGQKKAKVGGAHGAAADTAGEDDDSRALNRQEFFQCLVRNAMLRYVATGEEADVSRAIDKMFTDDLSPAMAEVDGCLQDSNAFRELACYNWETDDILTEHKASLRAIFEGYCNSSNPDAQLNALLSLEEWLALLTDTELIDGEFTQREAILAFVWSRHRVIDERIKGSRVKLTNLSLEDFYEALMRVSTMKALPTDDELTEAFLSGNFGEEEVPDAGVFILTTKQRAANDKKLTLAYDQWLKDHANSWNSPPRQKYHRCLAHLIELLVRTIDGRSMGEDDLLLTKREVIMYKERKDLDRQNSKR